MFCILLLLGDGPSKTVRFRSPHGSNPDIPGKGPFKQRSLSGTRDIVRIHRKHGIRKTKGGEEVISLSGSDDLEKGFYAMPSESIMVLSKTNISNTMSSSRELSKPSLRKD